MRCELDYYPCPVMERKGLFRVAPALHPQHQTGVSSRVCVPTHRYAGRPRLPHHEQSLWPAVLASPIRTEPAYGWPHPSSRSVTGRDEQETTPVGKRSYQTPQKRRAPNLANGKDGIVADSRCEKSLLPLYLYDAAHSPSSSAPSPPQTLTALPA